MRLARKISGSPEILIRRSLHMVVTDGSASSSRPFTSIVKSDRSDSTEALPIRAVRGLLWGVRLNVESAGLASDRDGDLAGQARSAAHQNRLVRHATLSRAAGRNQAAIHGLGRAAP